MRKSIPGVLIILAFACTTTYAQRKQIDSLKQVLDTAQSSSRQLEVLDQLSDIYLNFDPDSSLYFALRANRIAKAKGTPLEKLRALRNRGDAVGQLGDDKLAISFYQSALKLEIPDSAKVEKGHLHRQAGVSYYHIAEYDKALKSFFSSLEYFDDDTAHLKHKAGVLNNIGNVFYFTNQKEAPKYYKQSLEIHEKLGNLDGIASQLGNLGLIYINQKDFDKAIEYSERSLKIYEQLGYEKSIARSQVNLAYAYKEVGKMQLALAYAKKSLRLRKKLNDVRGVATSTIMIGNIYYAMNACDKALEYLEEGLKQTRELGMRSYEWEVMYYLADCYAKAGLKDKALEIYPKVVEIRDSINQQEFKALMTEMETKYETLEKEAEIDLLTKEAEISDLKLKRRETYLGAAAMITFLLAVISFIIYLAYRNKTKTNNLLEAKNKEISHQKTEIEEKNEHITDSIRYAQNLQSAILPKEEAFKQHFKDFHLLYQPKDIVSGDFYWLEELNGLVYIAVADCTGHGVPGAMVSMVGFQGLNKAVLEEKLSSPAIILQRLSDHVEEAFEKSGGSVKDGMDICLCKIDRKTRTVSYAGAHNALWILSAEEKLPNARLREKENGYGMFVLPADRRSIGGFFDAGPFTEKTVQLQKDDRIFLFSDGYGDQFGGSKDKKMGSKRMRQTFMELSLKGQFENIGQVFHNWKGEREQLDDVTVISVLI